jgi:hypothetical protein
VQARIQAIIDLLLLHPHIGTRTDDPAIRRMTTSPYPYLIFYEATDAEIVIHAIRQAARDPSGMPAIRPGSPVGHSVVRGNPALSRSSRKHGEPRNRSAAYPASNPTMIGDWPVSSVAARAIAALAAAEIDAEHLDDCHKPHAPIQPAAHVGRAMP